MYQENNLRQYVDRLDEIEAPEDDSSLTCSERVLMEILKSKSIASR